MTSDRQAREQILNLQLEALSMYQAGQSRQSVIEAFSSRGMPQELAEMIADNGNTAEQSHEHHEMRTMSAQDILDFNSRLPYSSSDMAALRDHFETARRNYLDITLKPNVDLELMMRRGVLVLESQVLGMEFCFVKVDAGRGFLGWQKSHIATYVSDLNKQKYKAGPILPGLIRALTGINNIYRDAGILRGMAI